MDIPGNLIFLWNGNLVNDELKGSYIFLIGKLWDSYPRCDWWCWHIFTCKTGSLMGYVNVGKYSSTMVHLGTVLSVPERECHGIATPQVERRVGNTKTYWGHIIWNKLPGKIRAPNLLLDLFSNTPSTIYDLNRISGWYSLHTPVRILCRDIYQNLTATLESATAKKQYFERDDPWS